MSNTPKTRSKSACQLSNLMGKGLEFLPLELSTSRDILKYGLHLRETSKKNQRNYTVDQRMIYSRNYVTMGKGQC